MAFIRENLSPVGAQGRAGVVPQIWSYTTADLISAVKTDTPYFPIDNSLGAENNMLGNFRTNDWIMVTSSSGTVFTIIFINNDGSDGNDISILSVDITAT